MRGGVLWEVQFLSEVVFVFHDVGETLVGDVEEVDEGLHVACFKKTGADVLPVVILVLLGHGCHGAHLLFEPLLVGEFVYGVFLATQFVEEDGGTDCLAGLLHGLDFALLVAVLASKETTTPLSYPFIIEQ